LSRGVQIRSSVGIAQGSDRVLLLRYLGLLIARSRSFYLQFCLLIHCNALIVFLVVPVMLNLRWLVCLQFGILILSEPFSLFLVIPPI
jgi:hypothetical protein